MFAARLLRFRPVFAIAAMASLATAAMPSYQIAQADGCIADRVQIAPNTFTTRPPDGFNPLQATNEELTCYGFPLRPVDAQALAAWEDALSHYRQYVHPQPMLTPLAGDTRPLGHGGVIQPSQPSAANWAGYAAKASDQSYPGLSYYAAYGQWTVPAPRQNTDDGMLLTWAGLGGDRYFNSYNIIQAGTWSCDRVSCPYSNSVTQYGFWYENWPQQGNWIALQGLSISAGQQAYTQTTWQTSGTVSYFFENLSSGTVTNVSQNGATMTAADLQTVEWILEFPTISDHKTGQFPFNTVVFTQLGASATYNGGYVGQGFDTWAIHNSYISNYANPAATIDGVNHGFHVCYGATNQC